MLNTSALIGLLILVGSGADATGSESTRSKLPPLTFQAATAPYGLSSHLELVFSQLDSAPEDDIAADPQSSAPDPADSAEAPALEPQTLTSESAQATAPEPQTLATDSTESAQAAAPEPQTLMTDPTDSAPTTTATPVSTPGAQPEAIAPPLSLSGHPGRSAGPFVEIDDSTLPTMTDTAQAAESADINTIGQDAGTQLLPDAPPLPRQRDEHLAAIVHAQSHRVEPPAPPPAAQAASASPAIAFKLRR
jgi:hypothetical protein